MKNRKDIIENLICFLVIAFCYLFFFRNVILTDGLFGDSGDGRLCTLITEHWWRVLTGKDAVTELNTFHPSSNEIGYTDMFLGFGIIHSVFRLFGIEMYRAFKYTILTLNLIGAIFTYLCLNRQLKLSKLWALFGTISFSFSLCVGSLINHPQLSFINIIPVTLFLLLSIWDKEEKTVKRELCIYILIILLALLAYSSWYIFFFTGLFLLLAFLLYFFLAFIKRENAIKRVWDQIKYRKLNIILYFIIFLLLLLPFFIIYLTAMSEGNGYSYGGDAFPEIVDILGISKYGFITGYLYNALKLFERGYSNETEVGFSIITLTVFIVSLVIAYKRKEKINEILFIVILTVIISIFLVLRLSSNGVSLWIAVYYLIPGAKAIRATGRFVFWLSFPLSIIASILGDKYLNRKTLAISFILLLWIFSISKNGVYSSFTIESEYNFLNSVEAAPESAEIVYIISPDGDLASLPMRHLDAMDIAYKYDLKTINGYSGLVTKEYEAVNNIFSKDYEENIMKRIEKYDLHNVYSYSLKDKRWRKIN